MIPKTNKLNDTDLLEHNILENIPNRWKQECDLKGIDEYSIWNEVVTFTITREEYFSSNHQRKRERNNPIDNIKPRDGSKPGNDRSTMNTKTGGCTNRNNTGTLIYLCKLPNHEKYEWSSYFNNLNSSKFKNTALTPKHFYTDGKIFQDK